MVLSVLQSKWKIDGESIDAQDTEVGLTSHPVEVMQDARMVVAAAENIRAAKKNCNQNKNTQGNKKKSCQPEDGP